jgi:mRNA-degrading endonuclease RelE of RelBE toxin-antitoxin system
VTYKVTVTGSAQRSLQRLPPKAYFAVAEFIAHVLAENPYRVGKALADPLEGLFSARVQVYRVLYTVDDDTITVEVVRVGHRSDIYG